MAVPRLTRQTHRWRRAAHALSAGPAPLCLLVLLGAGLRMHRLDVQSIWYDEAFSVYLASQPALDLVAGVEPDHLPLYFLLLHFWMPLAGQSELALRYLSLLFGVLAIPLVYVLGRRLLDRWTAVAAAAIAAVSPFFVYYSQETRMYSLVAVQATLATYLLARAARGERRLWLPYALVAASLLYTHYYGLLFVGAQALLVAGWFALALRRQGFAGLRPSLVPWLAAEAGIALAFLPWALARAHVFETHVSAARASLTLESIFWKVAIAFGLGHSVETLIPNSTDPWYYADHRLATILSLGFLAIAALGLARSLHPELGCKGGATPRILGSPSRGTVTTSGSDLLPHWAPVGLLVVTLLVVPVLAAYLTSVGRRDFTARYLTPIAPVYYLLLAGGLDALRRRSAPLLGLAALFLFGSMAFALSNYYGEERYARDDFRSAAAYLAERSQPGEAVLCNARYSRLALDYYRPGKPPCVGLPAEYPPSEAATEQRVGELARSHELLWLVLWQDYYSDPDHYLEGWLNRHAYPIAERRLHGGVRVKGYLTSPPIVAASAVPNRLDAPLGDRVKLVGYELSPAVTGDDLRVALYWQPLGPLPESYTAFVHLVDATGRRWAQHDSPPVNGSFPTDRWRPGQVIRDEHTLVLPAFTPPVGYRLEVGLYEPGSLRRLGEAGRDRVEIPGLKVERGDAAPNEASLKEVPNRVEADFGGQLALLGHALSGPRRGGEAELTLYWRALSTVPADYTVFVHLLDSGGQIRAQGDSPPAGGIYPTSAWQPGEVVRDPRPLRLPANLPPGEYRLVVGLYDPATGRRLETKSAWWAAKADKLTLRTVRLD